ncbi:MAG: rRNA maturation RNase YbeY [Thermodesulfobacteriota bacterium]
MEAKTAKNRVSVLVVNRSRGAKREHLTLMKSCARRAAGLLPLRGEISIAVIDDEEMRELNRIYRNISRTTDVLSFEQDGGGLAGDIVISFETALRRAKLYGITPEEEIKKLIVHGAAHLAGHRHKKKREGETMRAEEAKILRAVSNL